MADETPKTVPPVTEKEDSPPQMAAPESDLPAITPSAATEPATTATTEKEEPSPAPESKATAVPELASVAVGEEEEITPPPPQPATEEPELNVKSLDNKKHVVVVEPEKLTPTEERKVPLSLVSFKEESNVVADLSDSERKALQELKQLVQEALNTNQFTYPPPQAPKTKPVSSGPSSTAKEAPKNQGPSSESDVSTEIKPPEETKIEDNPEKVAEEAVEEESIWGIPLLKDDRSDVILQKFLRARDFKVKDAFVMIRNTIRWRKEFKIDELLNEDLGDDLEKVVFMHGYDREGHPVCYNVYGEFQNKELYQKTFSDEEKRTKFLRWRIQFLERSIRKLDFSPGGISTIFQVNDLKNSPGPGKRELRLATKQALQLLQDNYPEFVAKQVFINVPWWYLAFYTMLSPFMTQRTKSKFVFAGPAKSAETLFKYISPEHVPVQYGGLSVDYCDCNPDFSISDPVTEVPLKPTTKQTVEIIIYEKCIIVWELRVVGWEVSYSAEFVPDAKDAYTIVIQKAIKMSPTDEPVVSNNFKVGELGKILLTVDNPTLKKKRLLYRFKAIPISA
ncbi:patellin-3-like [Quillaja saponaria]|uniref:Patellin-3-like n=1 Tax=Quillaja saponaria TaxID=32244 RepID=A0AAD7PCD3_QUISA|nr:patellin-3-like [Quillaja saponaria]